MNRKIDIEITLKRLYGLRSKAAHGATTQTAEFMQMAPTARRLLARCIHSIAKLIDLNELDLLETKGNIGKSVTNMVGKRVRKAN